jgi:preprotein translocase subunit SecE
MAKAEIVAEETSGSFGALQPGGSLGGYFVGMYRRTVTFISDVRGEMKKVVTPSRQEVRSTTMVVLVTVAIFATYFYLLDRILGQGIHWMLTKLSGQ